MGTLTPSQRSFRRNRFKGRPTASLAGRGTLAAVRNARRLYDDAEVLMKARRYPSAVALAVLALEEVEKAYRVWGATFMDDEHQRDAEWAGWREHLPKLSRVLGVFLQTRGLFSGSTGKRIGASLRNLPEMAVRLKERALYVELLEGGIWSEPPRVVTRVWADLVMSSTLAVLGVHLALVLHTNVSVGEALSEDPKARPVARAYLRWVRSKRAVRLIEREARLTNLWLERHKKKRMS